jgi:hypothetical protein
MEYCCISTFLPLLSLLPISHSLSKSLALTLVSLSLTDIIDCCFSDGVVVSLSLKPPGLSFLSLPPLTLLARTTRQRRSLSSLIWLIVASALSLAHSLPLPPSLSRSLYEGQEGSLLLSGCIDQGRCCLLPSQGKPMPTLLLGG